jgi:hypothetical protein
MANKSPEEIWRGMLTGEIPFYRTYRRFLGLIPSRHRCKNCNAPFDGPAGVMMRFIKHGRYHKNPRFCTW